MVEVSLGALVFEVATSVLVFGRRGVTAESHWGWVGWSRGVVLVAGVVVDAGAVEGPEKLKMEIRDNFFSSSATFWVRMAIFSSRIKSLCYLVGRGDTLVPTLDASSKEVILL